MSNKNCKVWLYAVAAIVAVGLIIYNNMSRDEGVVKSDKNETRTEETQILPSSDEKSIEGKTSSEAAAEQKVYGDWKLACQKSESAKKEVCALQQNITVKQDEKQVPVAAYEFTYTDKKDLKMIQVLPQGVLLQPGTSLIVGEKVIANAKFTVCQNGGCIAVADIAKEDLKLILSKDSVALGMFNSEGKQTDLLVSTKGLKEGLEALKDK